MYYLALAADFDDTLAQDGIVAQATLTGLARLRETGRRLVLVTGRELADLQAISAPLEAFHFVVAENGAVLYCPGSPEQTLLAQPPPPGFAVALRRRGVSPLTVGRVIVATREPHQDTVLETIRELGLELHVIFNKGAVMVLPSGVNKATGLTAALAQLKISPARVVGVGDAENDQAFLARCKTAVAVANALPALKNKVDLVTRAANGAGVVELIDRLVQDDLADLASRRS
jgi:hydroxymethylpyrimidine pyrophosphatase-like HAD family hydrolase